MVCRGGLDRPVIKLSRAFEMPRKLCGIGGEHQGAGVVWIIVEVFLKEAKGGLVIALFLGSKSGSEFIFAFRGIGAHMECVCVSGSWCCLPRGREPQRGEQDNRQPFHARNRNICNLPQYYRRLR